MDVAFEWAQVVLAWGIATFFAALGLGGLVWIVVFIRDSFR